MSYLKRMLDEWARTTPGVTIGRGLLDTPEKRHEYEARMEEATREAFAANARARAASWVAARSKVLY